MHCSETIEDFRALEIVIVKMRMNKNVYQHIVHSQLSLRQCANVMNTTMEHLNAFKMFFLGPCTIQDMGIWRSLKKREIT